MTIYKTPYEGGMCFVTIKTADGKKFAGQAFSSTPNANAAVLLLQELLEHLNQSAAEVVTNKLKPAPHVDWNKF